MTGAEPSAHLGVVGAVGSVLVGFGFSVVVARAWATAVEAPLVAGLATTVTATASPMARAAVAAARTILRIVGMRWCMKDLFPAAWIDLGCWGHEENGQGRHPMTGCQSGCS